MTTVLIAGGYGVVGAQVAALLAERHPALRLLLGGRHPDAAETLAASLPCARPQRLDLDADDPLATLETTPDVILVAANDGHDRLLRSGLRRSIPVVDITRWTERVRDALAWTAAVAPRAPVVLASSWMAAIPATLAVEAARAFAVLARIDLDILFALRDRAGPNSVEYMDRLATAFMAQLDHRRVLRTPFSEHRSVSFTPEGTFTTALFDSPDQMTLPAITGAASVAAYIGFDHEVSNTMLRGIVRSGLWRAISGPAFTGLRRKLLFNPGPGDHHRVRVTLNGYGADGRARRCTIDIDDPAGQTHLTALGAAVQVERVLGLGNHLAAAAGVQFAEAQTDATVLRQRLADAGVDIRLEQTDV
jgi:hypothetical protein